jgi:K+-sensing histidine kinase KdpD
MQANAISGPWAAGDRVLVCVDDQPRSASLVRYAARLADRLRAPLVALHVEKRRDRFICPRRRATALRQRCVWPNNWAQKR